MASINTVLTWIEHDTQNLYFPIVMGSEHDHAIRRVFHCNPEYER
jgi:hypothetical protein